MVIAGLARTGAIYLLSIPVMMMWTISGPAAQGMMTKRVSEREQGELQGAISSLRSLAVLIGPGLFTFTFCLLHRQKPSMEHSRRTLVFGRGTVVHRHADVDANTAITVFYEGPGGRRGITLEVGFAMLLIPTPKSNKVATFFVDVLVPNLHSRAP